MFLGGISPSTRITCVLAPPFSSVEQFLRVIWVAITTQDIVLSKFPNKKLKLTALTLWATLTSVNRELCFHLSTWYNAHKVTLTKNIPFKFTLLRNVDGHRVDKTGIPCYTRVHVTTFSLPLSLVFLILSRLLQVLCANVLIVWELNESLELTHSLRKSMGLLKALRQSITEVVGPAERSTDFEGIQGQAKRLHWIAWETHFFKEI